MKFGAGTALAVVVVAGGALAGCGGGTTRAVSEAPAPKTTLVTAGLSNADIYGTRRAPSARPVQSAALPPAAAQPEASRPQPLPPGAEDPSKLVGFDPAALEALLGRPAILRQEGKAELWQYRAANCVLDVFLHAGRDGRRHVIHVDLRGRRDHRAAPQGCYADIVAGGAAERPQTARN